MIHSVVHLLMSQLPTAATVVAQVLAHAQKQLPSVCAQLLLLLPKCLTYAHKQLPSVCYAYSC